jgi:PAS domain S-box-containing protein
MQDSRRVLSLILIMIIVCLVVSFVSIFPLYKTALNEEKERLKEAAQSQARLIESVAAFDAVYSNDYPKGSTAATLSQITNAHKNYNGFGKTGEFTLARKEGDYIVFLLAHKHHDLNNLKPVKMNSNLAEPMRLALSGKSGTIIGLDYRGEKVLAAYEPVDVLNLGIVAKIDIAEVRRPFVLSIIRSLIVSLLLIGISIIAFYKIGHPLIKRLEKNANDLKEINQKLLEEIENHKKTGKMLKENEAIFRSIFENASDGILLSDVENKKFFTGNKKIAEMLGYDLSELTNLSVMDIHPPDEVTKILAIFKTLASGEIESAGSIPCLRKNGSVFYADINSTTSYINGIKYNVGFFRDITSRKKSEEALRESESFTRTVMENLPIGIAVNTVTPTVDFKYVNDNFFKIYRTTREKLNDPDAFWEAVYEDPENREEIRKKVLDDCNSGDPDKMHWEEVCITRKGEETTYVNARNIPIPSKNLMISIVWDVTRFRKLEKQLEQAQKMEAIGNLAGGVAHDYNNISSIILGYAELALESVGTESSIYNDLKEIIKATNRSIDITKQLLAFARKQTVAPKIIDLNDTIENMLKMVNRLIGEDIDLAWLPCINIWPVKIDPSQIDQIVINLCVNARDAIENTGKITIETANVTFNKEYCDDHLGFIPGEYIMLVVSDDGKGMTPEQQDKIFEPFYTTKGFGKGTGLGLATVYGIVKQNNGFINVYSEPGKGTTLKIYLPKETVSNAVEINRGVSLKPSTGKGETILLVEDDSSILKLGVKILTNLSYNVISASSPHEAITLAADYKNKIDLLITDVILPEMNGRELSEKLRKQYANLKVLFMSGYTANVIAHRGVLEDGINFLTKPFSKDELAKKVREVLDSGSN